MRLTPWRKQAPEPNRGSGGIRRLRDEMDRLFDSFFGSPRESDWSGPASAGGWAPEIEVLEGDKEITVRAEIPGLDARDVDVSISGNRLTLSGEKKESAEERKSGSYHSERRYGYFHRTIELPAGTKAEQVTAEVDKGVLTLKIPKTEAAGVQRIPIRTAPSEAPSSTSPKQTK
jgi:HSP20 family protein